MIKYFPIPTDPYIRADHSELVNLTFKRGELRADFVIPSEENKVLRVYFKNALVFRVLDEMPISTEEKVDASNGLVPYGFAYRVENARFWQSQSDVLPVVFKEAQHYRFITGGDCLDVIAESLPTFSTEDFDVLDDSQR